MIINKNTIRNKRRAKKANDIYSKFMLILISILIIFEVLNSTFIQISVQNPAIKQVISTGSSLIDSLPTNIIIMPITMPSNTVERANLVRMAFQSLGYSDANLERWMKIAKAESGSTYDPNIEPSTWVFHCKKGTGYYAVELNSNRRQAYCSDTGGVQVHKEKSKGIVQILPSTWRRNNCNEFGAQSEWFAQLQCADRILKKAGWTQWTTS